MEKPLKLNDLLENLQGIDLEAELYVDIPLGDEIERVPLVKILRVSNLDLINQEYRENSVVFVAE